MTNTLKRTISFLGAALMATQLIGATRADTTSLQNSSSAFEQAMPVTPAQEEVEKLLRQISLNAVVAGRHAETLETFTRGSPALQYETHVGELNRIREAINNIGSDFQRLRDLRPSALPWQQMVIDRIEPVLVGLADHATAAIERLNMDRRETRSQEYRDSVENLYTHATQARNVIRVNLEYAESREKLNRMDVETLAPLGKAPMQKDAETSSKAPKSLEQMVRSELMMLPYYGVFDHLAFRIDGDQVTLIGSVTRPTLKTDAERVIRRIEGVGQVANTIEVLPLSSHDDRIRFAAYRAIYGHSVLGRYRLNPNPPIRIIVNQGSLTLMGVVGNDMDRSIAHMQANGVPGAFSVTNNLQIGS